MYDLLLTLSVMLCKLLGKMSPVTDEQYYTVGKSPENNDKNRNPNVLPGLLNKNNILLGVSKLASRTTFNLQFTPYTQNRCKT